MLEKSVYGGREEQDLLKVGLELWELLEQGLADATLLRRLDLAAVLDLGAVRSEMRQATDPPACRAW